MLCLLCCDVQLDIAFRQVDDQTGEPLRQGPPEIAAALGIALPRAQTLLQVCIACPPACPTAARLCSADLALSWHCWR